MISAGVLAEIALAPPADAAAIQKRLAAVQPTVHPTTAAGEAPARAYIAADVLPQRREADALHVAAATCFGTTFLVSWNHRHMTRPSKRLQYEAVNRLNGYLNTPLICNPVEAWDELQSG